MPAKKRKKKSSTKKKKTTTRAKSAISSSDKESINKLVQNNLELQKVSLKLAESTDQLNNRIGRLVGLFEEAAKNVGVVDELKVKEETEGLSNRLDTLLQQNKDLAKGLLLLEQYVRGRVASPAPMRELRPKPLPIQ
ncbi:MAG: hypothetical protein ABIH25_05020 [Candidatus Woesearchaeota archaeon]